MAVNITLNIFDPTRTNHLKRILLYFGKSLPGTWDGWKWVEEQGFSIDGPWALDNGNETTKYKVSKSQIKEWFEKGFLSSDALGHDNTTSFLEQFPENSIFELNFLDWS